MHSILIVDDDDFLRLAFKARLETEGYDVHEAADRAGLLRQLGRQRFHLILLDIVLNKDNGIELIGDIREKTDAPIIMVSSRQGLVDKVAALEMGADDYMAKPVEVKELLSRAKAHIRRYVARAAKDGAAGPPDSKILRVGQWNINPETYSVQNGNGEDAGLTKDEFDLLVTLARKPNVIFTREKLFEILKADNYDAFDRAIDIQIARIRRKLGDDARNPKIIKTVRKVGYSFVADGQQE